ncbi:MAG TPA: ribosome biogenesis GTP-binding protein YihA/YsxC [Candidatus Polarisedimenticolaceae bacterium]|nr:ribosome biogenesis GTP-binding protein YihA/YsxC [Candidatus Polarisedimenticolaceae bacterium]
MKIVSARFDRSVFRAEDEPKDPGPDILFLGRSNVGKSSLINRLLGTRGLARTSSTPGRTQSLNFYRINEAIWFVDLPGYGYAKVPAAVRQTWEAMIHGVLQRRRERIASGVLLVDARHAPSELDRTMREWLREFGLDPVIAVTKADKLSGNGRAAARRAAAEALGGEPILASAVTGQGIKEIWARLDLALRGRTWTSES